MIGYTRYKKDYYKGDRVGFRLRSICLREGASPSAIYLLNYLIHRTFPSNKDGVILDYRPGISLLPLLPNHIVLFIYLWHQEYLLGNVINQTLVRPKGGEVLLNIGKVKNNGSTSTLIINILNNDDNPFQSFRNILGLEFPKTNRVDMGLEELSLRLGIPNNDIRILIDTIQTYDQLRAIHILGKYLRFTDSGIYELQELVKWI